MEWNWLLFAGFLFRILYHIADSNYEFNFKTPLGKANIFKTGINTLLIALFYYLSFFYHADDKYQDGSSLIAVWVIYMGLGWAIDSFFLAVMTMGEKFGVLRINKFFEKASGS